MGLANHLEQCHGPWGITMPCIRDGCQMPPRVKARPLETIITASAPCLSPSSFSPGPSCPLGMVLVVRPGHLLLHPLLHARAGTQ